MQKKRERDCARKRGDKSLRGKIFFFLLFGCIGTRVKFIVKNDKAYRREEEEEELCA